MKINSILSTTEFVANIEKMHKTMDISYIDAVIEYCERNDIDLETAAGMIKQSRPIRHKIENEAEELNFLKTKSSKLPI